MILLRNAQFTNFKSLRNVHLEFSTDESKKLTVIRAANGTGKTSTLEALTWGLFGDDALTGGKKKRIAFRLSPTDWDFSESGVRIPICVEISVRVVDDESGIPTDYHIIRKQTEVFKSDDPNSYSLEAPELTVLRETPQGSSPVQEPELFLKRSILPFALQDIFFFDGDSALKFVDKDEANGRRDRVENAIRKLLGLEILELAEHHLTQANSDIVKRIRKDHEGTTVASLSRQHEDLENEIRVANDELTVINEDRSATVARKRKWEDRRNEILSSGGGELPALQKQLFGIEKEISLSEQGLERYISLLRDRLNTSQVLYQLSQIQISKALRIFDDLEVKKIIPNTLPEIIESTLDKGLCICGADTKPGSPAHKHLSDQLSTMKQQSSANATLLNLAQSIRASIRQLQPGPLNWFESTLEVQKSIAENRERLQTLRTSREALLEKVAGIPETDLQTVQDNIDREDSDLQLLSRQSGEKSGSLERLKSALVDIDRQITSEQKKEHRYKRSLAEQAAGNDLLGVVTKTISNLKNETLDEVSTELNRLFLEMIANVPGQEHEGSLIEGAVLTKNFDMQIQGPNGTEHNPGTYLSGAQRRALTIAFILSLVKVSGVSAVTVIDTPLGTTDGALRRSLLRSTIQNSRQLVLFLTFSEISGVEDIIDEYVGSNFTLSNSYHYPEQLMNRPDTDYREVIVCGCSHRESCKTCKRREKANGISTGL
jgi:DNA sulfur modification protein DndD